MTVDDAVLEVVERLPASPDAVFALLSDVERTAGLGPEHTAARWTSDARGVGAGFTGDNELGGRTWQLPCRVVRHEAPRVFAWEVGDPEHPVATWTYELAPDGDGTLVTQRFQHGPGRSFVRSYADKHPERADEIVAERLAMLESNMRTVLRAAAQLL